MLEFSIVTISAFVGILNQCVKYVFNNILNKDISKYIPIFSVVFGIILGICGYLMPNVDMGSNIIEAIFIGISAGSASTGVHQIGTQLNKKDIPQYTESDITNEIRNKVEIYDVDKEEK